MALEIIVIEDCENTSKNGFIARKGRLGWIYEHDKDKIGKAYHIGINLDGNRLRRDIPAWKVKLTGNKTESEI